MKTSISTQNPRKCYGRQEKKDPFLLFRAVQADHSELDGIWTDLVSELDLKASKKKNDYKFLRAVFEKKHTNTYLRNMSNTRLSIVCLKRVAMIV
ncbi:hypothetical protein [Algoriphagus boritolerans]|uniref:hypothetical protein n=1 Tax=Algoriphagus boritolerans TaxID=308111 RepID=UPI002FCE14BA